MNVTSMERLKLEAMVAAGLEANSDSTLSAKETAVRAAAVVEALIVGIESDGDDEEEAIFNDAVEEITVFLASSPKGMRRAELVKHLRDEMGVSLFQAHFLLSRVELILDVVTIKDGVVTLCSSTPISS